MQKPLISVIIPAFNAEQFISKAIDSVLNQTHKNIEIIVVNDGSKDNTEQTVKSYGNNIHYHFQENKGVAEARNFGINISKGDYIAFLDADDYVLPNMYEKMLGEAIEHNSDMVLCSIFLENEKGIRRKAYKYNQKQFDLNKIDDLKTAFRIIGNSSCNKIYKKTLIRDIEFPKFKRGEDALFVLECMLNARKINCLNEPLYVYFQNSLSATKSNLTKQVLNNYVQVNIQKRLLIKKYDRFPFLKGELKNNYIKFFLMYTNSIRLMKEGREKKLYWTKWLGINKNDFVKNTSITKIIAIHTNIDWVYYAGMLATARFIAPVLTRLNNLKFYINR